MISKRLRYEILRRDGYACRYCGATSPRVELTVDHVVPVTLGGKDDPSNLVAACRDCNAGKTSSHPDQPLVDSVAEDALRWSKAMKMAAEIAAAQRARTLAAIDDFDGVWKNWTYTSSGDEVPRPDGWEHSVELWLEAGLSLGELNDFIRRSMQKRTHGRFGEWKYLCGIAWRTLEQRQDLARRLLDVAADQ